MSTRSFPPKGSSTDSGCAAASAPAGLTAALPRLDRPTLFARARRGRTASTSRAHRLTLQLSARRLACRAEGGEEAGGPPAISKPTPCDRPPPRTAPPDAAGRSQARGRHRLRPRSPQARPHRKIRQRLPTRVPPRLHRLSRSCTQRADEAPAFAADRSLSGRSQLRCSRPADLGLPRSQPAHRAVGLCAAAPSRTLQPGGQQSHRTKADRGSPSSASVGARPVRLDRRGSARAAAERRFGRRAAPRVSAPTIFTKFRLKVAGNTYGSAA